MGRATGLCIRVPRSERPKLSDVPVEPLAVCYRQMSDANESLAHAQEVGDYQMDRRALSRDASGIHGRGAERIALCLRREGRCGACTGEVGAGRPISKVIWLSSEV